MMAKDIRRVHFCAKVSRPVHIEILIEDWEPGDELKIAKLNRSFYGTRDAAQHGSAEYTGYLVPIGFIMGSATSCNHKHANRELVVSVHGDDLTVAGSDQLKTSSDIKSDYLGPDAHHKPEIQVLNRTTRLTQRGLEYEPDQ